LLIAVRCPGWGVVRPLSLWRLALRLPGAVVGLPAVPLVIFAPRHAANLLWLKAFFAVAADARGPVHGRYAPEP